MNYLNISTYKSYHLAIKPILFPHSPFMESAKKSLGIP